VLPNSAADKSTRKTDAKQQQQQQQQAKAQQKVQMQLTPTATVSVASERGDRGVYVEMHTSGAGDSRNKNKHMSAVVDGNHNDASASDSNNKQGSFSIKNFDDNGANGAMLIRVLLIALLMAVVSAIFYGYREAIYDPLQVM
jgi:hypothetical protein